MYPPFRVFPLVYAALFCALLFGAVGKGYGQDKTYATVTPSSGRNGATFVAGLFGTYNPTTDNNVARVHDPGNAGNSSDATYTRLEASNLNVLGLLQWSGETWTQMKFSSNIDANTTTFVRIDAPTAEGITVDLLETLGGLLGLLDKKVIIPEVYTGASAAGDGTKLDDGNVSSTIVMNGDGHLYLAISATQYYNSVRVKLRNQGSLLGLSLGSKFFLNIYNAFILDSSSCGIAAFTDLGKTTGISVALTSVVENPERAIDNDPNSYSALSGGTLGVATSTFQTLYFSGRQDFFKIKLALVGGLLDLNLLGRYEITAYNGSDVVQTFYLNEGLLTSLDLLGLLQAGQSITIPFDSPELFDRISIGLRATVNLNIASPPLSIYYVETAASTPKLSSTDIDICRGDTEALLTYITSSSTLETYSIIWDGSPTGFNNIHNAPLMPDNIQLSIPGDASAGIYTGTLTVKNSNGCESESALFKLTVHPKPNAPNLIIDPHSQY